MSDKKVLIYSMPTCPACKGAKAYLAGKGVSYQEIDVAASSESASELIKRSGQMGVPVILVDDEMVIGFDQAKLDALLAK